MHGDAACKKDKSWNFKRLTGRVENFLWKAHRDVINSPKTNYSCLQEETGPLLSLLSARLYITIQRTVCSYVITRLIITWMPRFATHHCYTYAHNSRLNIIGKRIPLTNALLNTHLCIWWIRSNEYTRNDGSREKKFDSSIHSLKIILR